MAESNQQRVNRILEHTRAGLGPYVLREFERVYIPGDRLRDVDEITSSRNFSLSGLRRLGEAPR